MRKDSSLGLRKRKFNFFLGSLLPRNLSQKNPPSLERIGNGASIPCKSCLALNRNHWSRFIPMKICDPGKELLVGLTKKGSPNYSSERAFEKGIISIFIREKKR